MAIHIKTVQVGQELEDWGQKHHQREEENGNFFVVVVVVGRLCNSVNIPTRHNLQF